MVLAVRLVLLDLVVREAQWDPVVRAAQLDLVVPAARPAPLLQSSLAVQSVLLLQSGLVVLAGQMVRLLRGHLALPWLPAALAKPIEMGCCLVDYPDWGPQLKSNWSH